MTAVELHGLFLIASAIHGLPPGLLESVCYVESNHRTYVVHKHDGSPRSSIGICQLQLRTARFVGFNGTTKELLDPKTNIEYSARYLQYQIQRYDGDYAKAVTAYNSGTTRSHGGSRYLARVFNVYLRHFNDHPQVEHARNDRED